MNSPASFPRQGGASPRPDDTGIRRLLVLHDSLAFGGHERMFLDLLQILLDDPMFDEIRFVLPAANQRLADCLAPLAGEKLILHQSPHHKRAAEPYRADLRLSYRRAIGRLVEGLRPAAALLVQGRIENCVVPMLALPRDLFLVSYIPMAHKLTEMGRSGVGDLVRRRLYQRPDRFIVPSAAVAEQLARAGARCEPVVVENRVAPPPPSLLPNARQRVGVPVGRRLALFLGRLDVRQKGLDLLGDAIERSAPDLDDWTFLFVGDGEGREMIESLARRMTGRVDVRFQSWTDDPYAYLSAADVLLMPSRWEGVPLVMLEAITYQLPILASHIDVFEEYLPSYARMDFARGNLAAAMSHLIRPSVRKSYVSAVSRPRSAEAKDRAARLIGAFERAFP